MTGIYKITNPIGCVYIGKSIDIKSRWATYNFGYCKGQRKLFLSFLKFGIIHHNFEIIELCEEAILDERERFFWEKYKNEDCELLNCFGPKTLNSVFHNKRKRKERHNKREIEYGNPITQFDLNGLLIKQWNSTSEASDCLNVSRTTLYRAIKNNYIVLKRFYFRNGSLNENILIPPKPSKKYSLIKYRLCNYGVDQISDNGELIERWNSSAAVSKQFEIPTWQINRAVKNNKKIKGFYWKRSPEHIKVIPFKPTSGESIYSNI